jgi:restriction endonuclease S subunit
LADNELWLDDFKFVPKQDVNEKDLLRVDEVLFNNTNSSAWVGKSLHFRQTGEFVCSNHITRLLPNKKLISPAFLTAILNCYQSLGYFNKLSTKFNNQAGINSETLSELLIPLPSLEVQRAIVNEIEAARDERRRKLAEADDLLYSLDGWLLAQLGLESPPVDNHKVFAVRRGDIQGRVDPYFYQPRFAKVIRELSSSRLPLRTIGNICEPPVGGATPTRGDAELYTNKGIKFLRILNVKPNEIDLADVKFIQSHVHDGELSRSQLAANDVLMTITGRVGTAAVVPQEILPANINQHIVRLRLKSAECLPDYLAAYLNTSLGLAISNRSVTGGTRIALDYQAIRSLPVPLPPKNVQEKVVEELNKRRTEAQRLRQEAEAEWQQAKKRFEEQLLTGDAA